MSDMLLDHSLLGTATTQMGVHAECLPPGSTPDGKALESPLPSNQVFIPQRAGY